MDLLYSRYARLASPIGRERVFMTMFIHMLEVTTAVLVGLLAFQVYRCYQAYYQSLTVQGVDQVSHLAVPTTATLISTLTTSIMTAAPQETMAQADEEPSQQSITYRVSPSEKILNDYIGEFFNEVPIADIQAFKAEPTILNKAEPTILNNVADAKSFELDEASSTIFVDQVGQAVNEPVLVDEFELDAGKRKALVGVKVQKSLSEDDYIKVEQELLTPVITDPSSLEPVIIESTRALNVPTLIDAISFDEEGDDSVITVTPLSSGQTGEFCDKVMSDKVVHAMLDEANLVCVS